MKYLPLSKSVAEKFSQELYLVTQPNGEQVPGNITTRYFNVSVSKKDPNIALLELPDEAEIPVHASVNVSVVRKAFTDVGLSAPDAALAATFLADNRRKHLDPKLAFPASVRSQMVDRASAEADGHLEGKEAEAPKEDAEPEVRLKAKTVRKKSKKS